MTQEQDRELTLDDFVWVFVGCGGTFYAASPYLAVLVNRYCKRPPILIDPDGVEESNESRQWPGWPPGMAKVRAASERLLLDAARNSLLVVDWFDGADSLLGEETDGRPVLAIVNVDNNRARLDVAEWLESRMSPGIMVVSGCERLHGQCYPGVWMGGEAVFDWREHHTDVLPGENGAPPVEQCNLQDVRANALTGVLVGMCIEDMAWRMENNRWREVEEYYWEIGDVGGVKMWRSLPVCRKEVSP